MIQLQRQPGESVERFLRRFGQKLRQTRTLQTVKNKKSHSSKPNKHQRKKSALHKHKVREKMDYLKKIGKIQNDERKRFF